MCGPPHIETLIPNELLFQAEMRQRLTATSIPYSKVYLLSYHCDLFPQKFFQINPGVNTPPEGGYLNSGFERDVKNIYIYIIEGGISREGWGQWGLITAVTAAPGDQGNPQIHHP
jgi:hypothetical protein